MLTKSLRKIITTSSKGQIYLFNQHLYNVRRRMVVKVTLGQPRMNVKMKLFGHGTNSLRGCKKHYACMKAEST